MRRKSKIFTPAMDTMVKDLYSDLGGSKTARAINEVHGTNLVSGQVWDRARSLGLKSNRSKMEQQNHEPKWDLWPEGFVGPCPHKAGNYLILSKSEPHRFANGKKTHKYWARCLSCGKNYHMLAPSLVKSQRHGRYGCNACAQKSRAEIIQTRKWRKDTQRAKEFNEWIGVMQLMPVTR